MCRVCVDVSPKTRITGDDGIVAMRSIPIPNTAIQIRGKQWSPGQEVTIGFMNGLTAQHDLIKQWAAEWEEHIGLTFVWVDGPAALTTTPMIRIRFDSSGGSWSYIGNDALLIPADEPTMNFGWPIDRPTTLHEFGHMLGLGHEHQNDRSQDDVADGSDNTSADGGIPWNEQVVIDFLSGPPNNWDLATIRFNVLDRLARNQTNGTAVDLASIMAYWFDSSWTLDGTEFPQNDNLSPTDILFVSRLYPQEGTPGSETLQLPVWEPEFTAAAIGERGEVDVYQMEIETSGLYRFETMGQTDVVMTLKGEGVSIMNDDSGEGLNSLIEARLSPGAYTLEVRHYSTEATGDYAVTAFKLAA